MCTVNLHGGHSSPIDLDLHSSNTPGMLCGFDQVTSPDPTSASSSVKWYNICPLGWFE